MPIISLTYNGPDDLMEVSFTGARPTNQEIVDLMLKNKVVNFGRVASVASPSKGNPGVVRYARSRKIAETTKSRIGLFNLLEITLRTDDYDNPEKMYRLRPVDPAVTTDIKVYREADAAIAHAKNMTIRNLLAKDIRFYGIEYLPCEVCGTQCSPSENVCVECGNALSVWGVEKPLADFKTVDCPVCGLENPIEQDNCQECGKALDLYGVRRPEEARRRRQRRHAIDE